jgi:hypothetical protein
MEFGKNLMEWYACFYLIWIFDNELILVALYMDRVIENFK